ncbi:hypothetical protein HELRODRAFT_159026 [Helobdella robusta]|uniref:Vitellogenin domain-containing protein n=1 Tax=Helobdella robusta TaxID=6412 RepID=T1ENH8_HELRO|nr:hypothetical protein HELRODRAFT_159026 [Helobdella robusta]ESO12484.1 hypothetical protein HELRODRAFT_159026 [Helobdella robusta]
MKERHRTQNDQPLDVEVTSHSIGHYEFTDDKLVKRFVAEEVQNVSPVIRAFQSAVVTARQEITLEGYADDETVLTDTFDSIILDFGVKYFYHSQLAQFVKKLRKGFNKVGTIENSRSFIKLVKCFREANNETIVEAVLKMKKHFAYYKILLDAVCVAQTFSSYKALMTLVDFKDESNILLEKILFSLSLATYPPEEYIAFLLGLIKHPFKDSRLYEAALNTLGALLHTMKKQTHQSNNMLVHNVEKVLLQKLNDCDNRTSSPSSSSLASCQEVLLRCLGNMGFTNSVSKIMEVVESSEVASVSETGLKALRHVDDAEIEKLKERLKNIFQQKIKKYELPARSEAFQLLLRTDLTEEDVEDIYAVSLDPSNQEFGSFIQSKLVDASKTDERLRNVIRKVQKNNVLNNYDTMTRKGSSLFFSSSFLDSPPITYSMYVENGKSHIVRRSGMSVDLHLTEEPDLYFPTSREPDDIYQQQREIKHRFKKNLQFYKFELFATGMEALLGEKQEDDNNNEHKIKEPIGYFHYDSAGLSLDIMGVSNRPTIFFKSQGELMSALWNAPSELTSAFQVNILLHDHHQRIQLENGMTVNLVVIGSISLDLSGSLLYSIWNKNAQSLIRNTVSYSLDTELELVDTKDTIKLNRRQDIQTAIDFMTDVNFSDATEMCLTMFTSSAPDLRYEINTYECLDGCKKPFKTSYKRAVTYQPQCYALPPKNYQLCNSMFYSSQ